MTYLTFLIPFFLLFAFITWRHFRLGLFFVFALLPAYLVRFSLGELPTTLLEIMIWIVLTIWVIKMIQNRQTKSYILYLISYISKYKLLFVGSALFLLAATVSIFTATDVRAAAGEWKAFYIEPFLIFLVLITTLRKKSEIRNPKSETNNNATMQQCNNVPTTDIILFGLVLLALTTSVLAIYQHFTGWMVPHAFWANRDTFRVTGWYGFPNGVGVFLAPIVPIAAYFVFKYWKILKTRNTEHGTTYFCWAVFLCSIISVPCIVLAIFYAKSTGGLLGVLAGIGVYVLASKKLRWPAIAVGLVGLVGIFTIPQLQPIETELTLQDRSGQIRIAMWSETGQLLRDNPIFGAGLGSYKHAVAPYHTRVNGEGIEIFHHPHNIFLTMWVNTGIIGLVGFLLIIAWFYKTGLTQIMEHKSWNTNPKKKRGLHVPCSMFHVCLLATMTALLATGAADSPYIKNDLTLFFWLLPALMLITTEETKQKST